MDFFRIFKRKRGIHETIFVSFLIVCIIPILIAAVGSYYLSADILADQVNSSFSETVSYVKDSVESQLYQLKQITAYIYIDMDLKQAIADLYSSPGSSAAATERLNEKLNNYLISNTFDYVNAIKVYGFNGFRMSFGRPSKLLKIDDMAVMNSKWFDEALNHSNMTIWAGMQNFEYQSQATETERSLGLFRIIKDETYKENIGIMYMSIDPAMFKTLSEKGDVKYKNDIYILDNNDQVVNDAALEANLRAELINIANNISTFNEPYLYENNTTNYYFYTINDFNWKVIGAMSLNDAVSDSRIIFIVTGSALLVYILISSIVWYFVSSKLTKPIARLSAATKMVRKGDFNIQVAVARDDELGDLTQNFNYMVLKIQDLIDEVINENTRKQDAEYRALQAQINPHFLYNTLNTIRWMAMIQKSDSIQNMVDALGRLLKSSTSKQKPIVTIAEEIDILKDYLYLQKIAYKNKFEVVWNVEEEALRYRCIKFILQPLVENSIFHGILPKAGVCTLSIRIAKVDESIILAVKDNGVGMKPSEVEKMLCQADGVHRNFSGIGVSNLFDRIKMTYGEQGNVTVHSVFGEYTEIVISLPASLEPEKEPPADLEEE
jgi:two-component system sensor histidine kinase YesM